MQRSKLIAIIVATTMLTACSDDGIMHGGSLNKQDVGTAVGTVAGGVIGYQFGGGAGAALATVGGALLGGMLGSAVGESMDNVDRTAYDNASYRAMESGRRQSWRNSDSGNYGTITPRRAYTSDGEYCREYTQTIYVDGKKHKGNGTACRQEDGSWQIIP